MVEAYSIGTKLSNAAEVYDPANAVTLEIMQTWIDPDDHTLYYIAKCVDVAGLYGTHFLGQLELLDHWSLDKYYREVVLPTEPNISKTVSERE